MAEAAAHQAETWIVDPQHTVHIVPVHTAVVHAAPAAAAPVQTEADKERLRTQLLRMILKSEAQRRSLDEV